LWKNEFEKTLEETDNLLSETSGRGPFFCGDRFTAADVAWAPFLERYAGQLPCLHDGLNPRCPEAYPHLSAWYVAMEELIPAYGCRVKGDASSWRKVLTMAGFGNAGSVPDVISLRMDELTEQERKPISNEERAKQLLLWREYASSRPHLSSSPNEEAASVLIRNRENIMMDIMKRINSGEASQLPPDPEIVDEAMRSLAVLLCDDDRFQDGAIKRLCNSNEHHKMLASFLDERMCVPRDMGSLSAAHFKRF